MDLLLISGRPPYPLHDARQALPYYLARELHTNRYLIDLLCFYDQPEDIAEIPRYERFFRQVQVIARPNPPSAAVRRRLSQEPLPKTKDAAWSAEMWQHIENLVTSRHFDLVQVVGDVSVYEYLPLIKTLPNVIVSPELPSSRLAAQLASSDSRWQRRQLQQELELFRHYESKIYEGFGSVVVTTPQHAEQVKKANSRVFVLPLGVDTDYYVPTEHDPKTPGILFIGNFAHAAVAQAALYLCRTILPAVQRAIPKTTLFLVGANPSTELRGLASETIVVTGRVTDLRPYFELASVFVSPLRSVLGFRQDILKAFAMLTPVVATPASCEGLAVQHGREVLLAESDDDFIRSIIRVLRDDQVRHSLQLKGRERIQADFSWQRIAARYAELHREIIGLWGSR